MMKYFRIDEPNGIKIVSERDVREAFYPYWYAKMCEKYGKERVDSNYCFADCLDDWKIINYAEEL